MDNKYLIFSTPVRAYLASVGPFATIMTTSLGVLATYLNSAHKNVDYMLSSGFYFIILYAVLIIMGHQGQNSVLLGDTAKSGLNSNKGHILHYKWNCYPVTAGIQG